MDHGNPVLLIDSDPEVARWTAALLTDRGWNVTIARTYDEAVAFIADHEFDVIITDVALDVGPYDGLWLLAQAYEAQPRARRVLVSADPRVLDGPGSAVGDPRAGDPPLFHLFLDKPLDRETVVDLRRLLGLEALQ